MIKVYTNDIIQVPVRIGLRNRGFDDVDLIYGSGGTPGPANKNGVAYVMPLRLKKSSEKGDFWTLPIEPLVSISGGNIVAKRNVSKGSGRGTVKERWTQNDYQITVEGILMNTRDQNEFPEEDLQKLRGICEAREVIEVECDLLKYFDIHRMVIENFEFPFTKGECNQRYSFSGYSDDITTLFEEEHV